MISHSFKFLCLKLELQSCFFFEGLCVKKEIFIIFSHRVLLTRKFVLVMSELTHTLTSTPHTHPHSLRRKDNKWENNEHLLNYLGLQGRNLSFQLLLLFLLFLDFHRVSILVSNHQRRQMLWVMTSSKPSTISPN